MWKIEDRRWRKVGMRKDGRKGKETREGRSKNQKFTNEIKHTPRHIRLDIAGYNGIDSYSCRTHFGG